MVSVRTSKRRSERREQTFAELKSENAKLKAENERLRKSIELADRKAEHGCTNFTCQPCMLEVYNSSFLSK